MEERPLHRFPIEGPEHVEALLNAWAGDILTELLDDDNFNELAHEMFKYSEGHAPMLDEDLWGEAEYTAFVGQLVSNLLARAIVRNRYFGAKHTGF